MLPGIRFQATDHKAEFKLLTRTREVLAHYDRQGLWMPELHAGRAIGTDARALGGALLPLHANFAPDRELFLKV